METLLTQGHVAPGFEGVADAFERSFAELGELGAALAVYRDGELVVDLWGGTADAEAGRPWAPDTLGLIFSGTKGLVATCLTMLLDRGALELDAPVARYWPEFAQAGKEHVTVAQIASHQARLPAIRQRLAPADVLDDVRMAQLLAAQPLEDDPRAARTYHRMTFGWLCGELVRRVTGKSVGRFFADEVAAPLGLDLWIGLPASEEPRVAPCRQAKSWGAVTALQPASIEGDELQARIYANPTLAPSGESSMNAAAFHAAEIPGANGIGTARSVARLYACLARGGELDGTRLCGPEAIALARREQTRFRDPFSDLPMAYGVGFHLQTENRPFGAPDDGFGHQGAGGSVHGAWPEQRIGFSYLMNELRNPLDDPRAGALLSALASAAG